MGGCRTDASRHGVTGEADRKVRNGTCQSLVRCKQASVERARSRDVKSVSRRDVVAKAPGGVKQRCADRQSMDRKVAEEAEASADLLRRELTVAVQPGQRTEHFRVQMHHGPQRLTAQVLTNDFPALVA